MFDPLTMTVIVATFLLAGGVKGVVGLGLPTVSLGVLTAAIDLTTAMALLIVPLFVTDVVQAVTGGNGRAAIMRAELGEADRRKQIGEIFEADGLKEVPG